MPASYVENLKGGLTGAEASALARELGDQKPAIKATAMPI